MSERTRQSDERGAILLIALFFAVFMVGMVYYVIGVAEAVLLSERMQDAVDASALSGAVMNARAMNFIVLINLVMSVLLAILVALKLVETLAIVGIILASALAYPTFGLTLPFVPILESVRSTTSAWYNTLKPDVETALELLNELETTVANVAPPAAKELAEEGIEEYWMPPVEFATVVPFQTPDQADCYLGQCLPVENDDYSVLCGKAGGVVGDLIALPFSVIDVEELSNAISGAASGAAREFSDWFCGSGGSGGSGGAPSIETTVKRHYPMLPSVLACEESVKQDKSVSERVCAASTAETADAEPDKTTGNCQAGHDCSIDGPYERSVRAARENCALTQSPPPVEISWQEQTGTVSYVWNGETWERGEETITETVQKHKKENQFFIPPPCGPERYRPMIVGYELEPHPHGDVNEVNPVCSEGGGPPVGIVPVRRGQVFQSEFRRVPHILGCRRDFEEEKSGSNEGPAASGDTRAPKKIIKDVKLGDEAFQLRSFARRKPRMAGPGRGVRVALWGADEPGSELGELEDFGSFAVAQSEYFYDGTEGEDGWMWNMKWRGRLKRFRLPEDAVQRLAFVGFCTAGDNPDDPDSPSALPFFEKLATVKDLVMH